MAVNNLSPHAIRELISRYEVELHKLQFQLERTEQTIEELRQAIPQAEQREAGKRRAKLNGGSREREAAEETTSETAAPSEAVESGAAVGRGDTAMEAGAEEQASPKRRGRRAGRPAKAAAAAAPKTEAQPAETEEKPRRRGRPKGTTSKAKAKPTAKAKPGRKKASEKDRSSGYRLSKYDELILQALDDRNKVLITTELQDFVEEQMRNEGQPVDPEDVRLRISRSLQKLVNRRKDLIKVPYGGRGFAYGRQNWFNKEGDLKSKYGR